MDFKNKNILILGSALILLLLSGGGYYVLSNNSGPTPTPTPPLYEEEKVYPITPEELGLDIQVRADKKAVKLVMTNADDVEFVDAQYNYVAKGDLPRGGLLNDLRPEDGKIETKMIDLGSCSSGRCKYDEGVEDVTFTLKITKKDGKVYAAEKKVTL